MNPIFRGTLLYFLLVLGVVHHSIHAAERLEQAAAAHAFLLQIAIVSLYTVALVPNKKGP